jgi:nucleoid-associated protein YgaU
MELAQAQIEVIDGSEDEARGLPQKFKVMFNPTKYSLNKGVQLAEVNLPGLDTPILQYVRGQNERLTMELFFDTTESGMGDNAVDVRTKTMPFYQLVKIQSKTHAPPRIKMTWGDNGLSFKAVVESVQQEFTLFSPKGIPLRATLNVTFREYKTLEDQISEFKLESPDYTKQHIVRRGETLSGIAHREYKDASLWRKIAQRNNLLNPRHIRPGMTLAIPPLDERVE